jgi:hypothetical protein
VNTEQQDRLAVLPAKVQTLVDGICEEVEVALWAT